MEILNRTNAPFGNGVWSVIDSTVSEFLIKRLNLRATVDFDEASTYQTDSISTGEVSQVLNKNGLKVQTREPIKMVEVKKQFKVSKKVIDDIKRGKADFDDKEFAVAANEFASIENKIILEGLKEANIEGILSNKEVNSVKVDNTKDILKAVAKSLGTFNKEFVSGPFKLIVSSNTLASLYTEFFDGISLKTKLDDILGADAILVNEDIGDDKALIISQRGEDFVYYSGLDVSIGYETETKDDVELFLIMTCAFKVYSPEAAIILNI